MSGLRHLISHAQFRTKFTALLIESIVQYAANAPNVDILSAHSSTCRNLSRRASHSRGCENFSFVSPFDIVARFHPIVARFPPPPPTPAINNKRFLSLCTDAPSPQKKGKIRVSNVQTFWLKEQSLNWHWKRATDGCNTVPTFSGNGMNFYRCDFHK